MEDWKARAEKAEAELARLRAPAGDELPDDLRAPLHSLQADREYLVARIQKADDEEAGLLSESIRDRLSQIEEAAYRLNARLRSPAGDVGDVELKALIYDLQVQTAIDGPEFSNALEAASALTRLAARVAEGERLVGMSRDRIEARGEWDDGCFYHNGTSASELQEPLTAARSYLQKDQSNANE